MWIRSKNKKVLLDATGKALYIHEYHKEDFSIEEMQSGVFFRLL
jgi:hypothetical protein